MFREALVDNESALIFPAGDVDGLAKTISRILQDAGLYKKLSAKSEESWNRIQLPVRFGDLLEAWLADDPVLQTD